MKSASRRDRFEVHDDLAFQRKTWRFERIGWVAMGCIVLTAALGLTGEGWLSRTTVTDDDGLRLEYERFLRVQAPVVFRLRIGPGSVADGALALRLDTNFVKDFDIERVVPEPAEWRLTPEGLELRFAADGAGPLGIVSFRVQPQHHGPGTAAMGISGRQPVQLRYFVYP